ncbi:MAG: hypothetical protein FWD43_01950 [Coriobacteriia bacterium]|nr:hypothetical protein [Coriobacteriia bacterium]
MLCRQCGAALNPDAVFCHICGATLTNQPTRTQPYSQGGYVVAPNPYSQPVQTIYVQPENPPVYMQAQVYGRPGAAPYPPQGVYPSTGNPGIGMGVASLILGICALCGVYAGPVFAIIALCLGSGGKRRSRDVGRKNGPATAGITMGIIGLIGWLIVGAIVTIGCLVSATY